MPRGRQYYDPIVQVPGIVAGAEDLARIELFPVTEDTRIETATPGKWMARRVSGDGSVAEHTSGDFDHDRALAQAQAHWGNLPVYELRSEFEDSTWDGVGPSPRLWQVSSPETTVLQHRSDESVVEPEPTSAVHAEAGGEFLTPAVQLRVLPITETGTYVLLHDICELLEVWAVQFEIDKNPSGALALREAVDTLKEVG